MTWAVVIFFVMHCHSAAANGREVRLALVNCPTAACVFDLRAEAMGDPNVSMMRVQNPATLALTTWYLH